MFAVLGGKCRVMSPLDGVGVYQNGIKKGQVKIILTSFFFSEKDLGFFPVEKFNCNQ